MNTKMKQCHGCGAFMGHQAKKCFRCGSFDLMGDHFAMACPTCGSQLEVNEHHGECSFCGEFVRFDKHFIIHTKYRGDVLEYYH